MLDLSDKDFKSAIIINMSKELKENMVLILENLNWEMEAIGKDFQIQL